MLCRGPMAEDKAPAKAKTRKKAKSAPPPRPPVDDAPFGWRTWATVGVVMVGGVIAWKLLGASYKRDIDTICNAEGRSGIGADKDFAKLTSWVRDHLGTPEGNEAYSALGDAKVNERSKKMQDDADQAHVGPCPFVASLDKLSALTDYRSDLQHLCSNMTFPKLLASEDPVRLKMLSGWIDRSAKSPRTKELYAQLAATPPGPPRATVLREAATNGSVLACDNAKSLEAPPPPIPSGAPIVKLLADPQIVGGLREDDLKHALDSVNPQLVDCYKSGIDRRPDLAGMITIKLQIDPTGKISRDGPGEGKSIDDKDTILCVARVVRGLHFPPVPGPMASAMIALQLTHADK